MGDNEREYVPPFGSEPVVPDELPEHGQPEPAPVPDDPPADDEAPRKRGG